jgi:hypothetical protein
MCGDRGEWLPWLHPRLAGGACCGTARSRRGEIAGALDGIRVIDFGHYLAGSPAGLLLADQGAEVIRVDRRVGRAGDIPPMLSFAHSFATWQDLNLGKDKMFNFDGAFNGIPVSSNSSSATVWSFGFSTAGQRRFRDPATAQGALDIQDYVDRSTALVCHFGAEFGSPRRVNVIRKKLLVRRVGATLDDDIVLTGTGR